jgi:hypothetical protein
MAKLRMHTDPTLGIFDRTTSRLGAEFRKFTDKTCTAFNTRELAREADARQRRQRKKTQARSAPGDPGPSRCPTDSTAAPSADSGPTAESSNTADITMERSKGDGPRRKKFNLDTYKYHSVGDYVHMISQVGTSDSYSTEPVSVYYSLFGG